MYRRQESRPSPKKKCQKAKWLSEEALQIAVKRREVKSKGEKERYSHLLKNFPQFIVIYTVKGFGIVLEELPHARGQGRWPRGANLHQR